MSKRNTAESHLLEVLYVNSKKISCDGGKGTLGHPKIYLNLGENNSVCCPYCSRSFIFRKPSPKSISNKKSLKAK